MTLSRYHCSHLTLLALLTFKIAGYKSPQDTFTLPIAKHYNTKDLT